jgi:hypothetical protein
LLSILAVLACGACLVVVPAAASAAAVRDGSTAALSAKARGVRYGPYATIRRANEVANSFRRQGYRARVIPIHNLGGYFVDVW